MFVNVWDMDCPSLPFIIRPRYVYEGDAKLIPNADVLHEQFLERGLVMDALTKQEDKVVDGCAKKGSPLRPMIGGQVHLE